MNIHVFWQYSQIQYSFFPSSKGTLEHVHYIHSRALGQSQKLFSTSGIKEALSLYGNEAFSFKAVAPRRKPNKLKVLFKQIHLI